MTAPDDGMWVEGDESGTVYVVCPRPECLRDGPVATGNPRGRWLDPIEVGYKVTPDQVRAVWDAHAATHQAELDIPSRPHLLIVPDARGSSTARLLLHPDGTVTWEAP